MRVAAAALGLALALGCARGAVVSQEWVGGKLSLKLDDGTAEIEWISPVAFRVMRSWGAASVTGSKLPHMEVTARLENIDSNPRMITRFLTVDLDRDAQTLRVRNGANEIATVSLNQTRRSVEARFTPIDRVYGLRASGRGSLNLRGEKLARGNGFFFASNGYGVFMLAPALCAFDFTQGMVEAQGSHEIEFVFYYGPSPKEILEQHTAVAGRTPSAIAGEDGRIIDSWAGLEDLVRTLNETSFSAVLYPVVNVSVSSRAPEELRRRVSDLTALVPGLRGADGGDRSLQAALAPYIATYRQETLDRGYPLIRPLAMEYPRDGGMELRGDLFLMGDELLVAPVIGEGDKRRVDFPRGTWTDLRTNVEYQGRHVEDVEAPQGSVPVFARNGSVVPMTPLGNRDAMELHYFPSLGGEFFLWEPSVGDSSQFHAAPAGDDVRVEIESKVSRTYEWVLHHTEAAKKVGSESVDYQEVVSRQLLQAGSWWHDDERDDLHIIVKADAGSDVVLMVEF